MNYDAWKYLYPPRPESAITPPQLPFYEKRRWVAQYKKNGQCAIIGIGPRGKFKWMGRHNNELNWKPTPDIERKLWQIFGSHHHWTVLIGELLHKKVTGMRDKLYLFDVLVDQGEYLIQSSFQARQGRLSERTTPYVIGEQYSHHELTDNLGVARIFTGGFNSIFNEIDRQELDEGLVLKNPAALLRPCDRPTSNATWQVKCRHPKKNYSF